MEGYNRRSFIYNELLPFTLMAAVECSTVVLNTLFKAATLNNGLSFYVFVTYSYCVAALALFPYNFIYRRKSLPPIKFRTIGKCFLLSMVGSSGQITNYRGIDYSSPTLCSALSNLIPAFTFILAIIFRMERFACRSFSFQAKVIGTIISIAGAFIVIFYKGLPIIFVLHKSPQTLQGFLESLQPNWVLGGFLLVWASIFGAVWYITLAYIMKEYPDKLVIIFFNSLFGSMICGTAGFVSGTNPTAWALKLDISLVAVLYSGLFGSFLGNTVHAWGIHLKGPVYVAMFRPLAVAIAAIMGVLFLGDTLYIGSIIGAFIISLGLYAVMWGKATEDIPKDVGLPDLEPSSLIDPLIRSVNEV